MDEGAADRGSGWRALLIGSSGWRGLLIGTMREGATDRNSGGRELLIRTVDGGGC